MSKENAKSKDILGEGNKSADRRYRNAQKDFAQSGPVDEKAKAAEKALEGKEGEELREAEKKARKGNPKGS